MDISNISLQLAMDALQKQPTQEKLGTSFADTFKKATDGLINTAAKEEPDGLKSAAQQLEAIFLLQMFSQMRKTIPQDGLFNDQSLSTQVFQGMLDQEVSIQSSLNGGIGLADLIYEQMMLNNAGNDSQEDK